MQDDIYCYPGSEVLINRLNIRSEVELFEAEKQLTFLRLQELQTNPVKGNFDFEHLKNIHKYIFQDVYDWAGKERTVEIGKGNLFCTTAFIQDYAKAVFEKYYSECQTHKNDFETFIETLSDNYGNVNALHPFREGNGRAQREFARLVCLDCGYDFDLSCTTHAEMLEASIKSFNEGDNSYLSEIFSKAVTIHIDVISSQGKISILTSDDLTIPPYNGYDHYKYDEYTNIEQYDILYKTKIEQLNK